MLKKIINENDTPQPQKGAKIFQFPNKMVKKKEGKDVSIHELVQRLSMSENEHTGFCRSPHTRRNMESQPSLSIPPFDRKGFHTDMFQLIKFKDDPQKMIDAISTFSSTYIWPAHVASLAYFEKAGDLRSLTVLNAKKIEFKRDAQDWDVQNTESIANRIIHEKVRTAYAFIMMKKDFMNGLCHRIDHRIEDAIHTYVQNKPEQNDPSIKYIEDEPTYAAFRDQIWDWSDEFEHITEEDLHLIRKNKNGSGGPSSSSGLLTPVFNAKGQIKCILYLGYSHPSIMCDFNGFDYTNLWDFYQFMLALEHIYAGA